MSGPVARMKPNPVHRLPAPLEAAVQTLKRTARGAVERTIDSLGLASLAAHSAYQRDGLLAAQFELNRKSAVFALTFNDAFDERVMREAGAAVARTAPTAWDALKLVDDHEVENQIAAERFGMDVAQACEWELREFDAYVATLLGYAGTEKERNPMRPEVIGHAMMRGVDAVSERADVRKLLAAEIGRSLGGMMSAAYADMVAEMRNAGVQPAGMSVRAGRPRGGTGGTGGADTASPSSGMDTSRSGAPSGTDSQHAGRRTGFSPSSHSGIGGGRGTPLGQVDPALMALIRQLAYVNLPGGSGSSDGGGHPADRGRGDVDGPLANLIHAHRDELRQASTGSLDHMVIDVIGSLFDQILSDPKVPPQMARQIARLQLPVLRAALGDPSFFSSRRHPVRRFVNRIASLGAGFEDFGDDAAQRFLAKVRDLVQEVVEGDFDQIETYDSKLAALEAFIAEQERIAAQVPGAAAELLSQKEDELRLRQLYAQRLDDELRDLNGPDFVRDFIARIWSQVVLRAVAAGGADSEQSKRLRRAGRELFMSVQPKPTPEHRKAFLAELPKLMQQLTEGMDLIRWPQDQRQAFFGKLMPAHAEALRNTGVRQLDINLLARQVEGALDKPLPSRDEVRAMRAPLPVLTDEVELPSFSADEARQVGLVQESSINWAGPVDIDLSGDEPAAPADASPLLPGLPATADTAEPAAELARGRTLADHVQIGFAYQMHLEGRWQKVRLSHVSAARSFFVFTHGKRHQQTVSMTHRMLLRLCETGRLRAFENDYLIERATARARRQLAGLNPAGQAVARA